MARHSKQTEELFSRLAIDLAVTRPDLVDSVLCPLCLRGLGREALDSQGDDRLTVEHIVPRALGGGLITLTCKKCNNSHGSEVDAHLVRMIRAHNSLAGDGSTLRGLWKFRDLELPVRIAWGSGGKKSVIQVLGGKPEDLSRLPRVLEALRHGDKIGLTQGLDYRLDRQKRAILRIAYLSLFVQFGYRYVLSGGGTAIRKLVVGETGIDELRRLTPHLAVFEAHGVFAKPLVISPVLSGRSVIAYMVIIRIEKGRERYFGALMPPPDVPEGRVIELLTKVGRELDGRRHSIRVMEPLAKPEP